MKIPFSVLFITSLCCGYALSADSPLSPECAHRIAEKIWKNECAGSFNGLTCWNKGESFASLGIGHFIWYPEGKKESFQESFPELLVFFESRDIDLPSFLKVSRSCPWSSRDAFYADINGCKMVELREFLYATRDLQAVFIVKRLENALRLMIKDIPDQEKSHVVLMFQCLEKTPQGLYALIDYLNFKGAGINLLESYQGKRWGLLQVLMGIPSSSDNIVTAFVASAKKVLSERVKNSPPERNEQQWLKGWHNRLDTYIE